jgi:O-antigen ligase
MLFDHVVVSSASGCGARVKLFGIAAAALIGILVSVALVTDMWFRLVLVMSGLSFAAFTLAYPRLGLFVWLLLAPVANEYAKLSLPTGFPDLTFGRVVVGLVSAAVLLRMVLHGRRLVPFGATELAMLTLVAIVGIDLVMRSGNPTSDALQNFDERVTPILLFLAARNLCVRRADLRVAAGILVVVGCYLSLHGAYQFLGLGSSNATTEATVESSVYEGGMRVNESHQGEGRAVGPFSSAVEFGSVTGIALLAALYAALYLKQGIARGLPLATVPVIAAGVIFSSTRSPWLGTYLGIALMAALDRRLRIQMLTALGMVTVVAVIAAVVLTPESSSLRERASSTEPISGRLVMYEVGLRIAARRPLTGYGRGAPSRIAAREELFALGSPDADLAPGQFHNVFLTTLVEWGIVGLLAYLWVLALLVKGALDLRRRLADRVDFVFHFAGFFLCAVVVFASQGMLVDIPQFFYLNGVLFFLAGLVFAQLDAGDSPLNAQTGEPA